MSWSAALTAACAELLRGCLVRRELPDPPAAHHVLVTLSTVWAPRDRPDPEVIRKGQATVLRCTRGRDRVKDQRALARVEEVVVPGRIPAEDLIRFAALVDVGHELHSLDRALVLDRDLMLLVLDERAEAHQEAHQSHVRVELRRLSDPERMAGCLQLRRCLSDVLPGIR